MYSLERLKADLADHEARAAHHALKGRRALARLHRERARKLRQLLARRIHTAR